MILGKILGDSWFFNGVYKNICSAFPENNEMLTFQKYSPVAS